MTIKYTDHNFAERGSLASQCDTCGTPFSLAVSHNDWPGRECRPYTRAEQFQTLLAWNAYIDSITTK